MRISLLLATAALGLAALPATAADNWGFDRAGENTAVKPGDNFNEFANGTYNKNLQIPADQSRYGAFNVLRDLSETRTHAILEDAAAHAGAAPKDAIGKAGAMYKAFMDEATVEKRRATPLAADLELIRAVKTPGDFATLLGRAPSTFLGGIFELQIQPDAKDPNQNAIYVGQGGLGLPDRDYYLEPSFAKKLALYPTFVEKMLTLAGWPDAHAAAAKVVAFETVIAQDSWSRADRRDDDKTYNPTTLAELKHAAPGFDWARFFTSAGLGSPARVILGENTAIIKIAGLVGSANLDTLRAWAAFHLAMNASGVLPHGFVDASYEFLNKTLQGQPEQKPRWKRAVHAVELTLGEAVGEAYVAKYYPPEAAQQMAVLTKGLRDAFRVRLQHNDWMSPATRAKALEKLATFDFQIGHPKKWRDYSKLSITADDLYGDVERGAAFDWAFQLSHVGHKVDRDLWDMFPQTVNAYNNPLLNEVVFPAAILQPPFFNAAADPAVNYGGIGGVIGHEMTHSFDDQGRKHDAHGVLKDWWTAEDAKRFEERAAKFGAQYAKMDILPGAHINPALTMGENIADLGGLTMALEAYHASLHGKPAPVIDGLTGDQRVFLGWAQVWRGKSREDAARQLLTIDPHSPPAARVNGPVHNIDAWYTAFDVQPGQTLYLAPADRVKIW